MYPDGRELEVSVYEEPEELGLIVLGLAVLPSGFIVHVPPDTGDSTTLIVASQVAVTGPRGKASPYEFIWSVTSI